MIIYNPHDEKLLAKRIAAADALFPTIPAKHCFITGSFPYKEKYKDIDVFVVTRSKKKIVVDDKKVKITVIDFNDLYSLFYHSLIKSCVAKDLLPVKSLKVTLADYWQVINEAVPAILNRKANYKKDIRFLILYTHFFKTGKVLDTVQLDKEVRRFTTYQDVLQYIEQEVPLIMNKGMKKAYLKRFFYTQAGQYKGLLAYKAQNFLYQLTHKITGGFHG